MYSASLELRTHEPCVPTFLNSPLFPLLYFGGFDKLSHRWSTGSVTESSQHLPTIMFNPYGVIFHRRFTFRGLRQAQPPMEDRLNHRINEIVRVLNRGRTSRASLHFSTLLCLSSHSLNKRERIFN